MKTYAGIDLHSSNNYIVVIDQEDKRLFEKRLPNTLEAIIPALEPFLSPLKNITRCRFAI